MTIELKNDIISIHDNLFKYHDSLEVCNIDLFDVVKLLLRFMSIDQVDSDYFSEIEEMRIYLREIMIELGGVRLLQNMVRNQYFIQ